MDSRAGFLDLSKGYLPVIIVIALAALLFQAGAVYTQLTGGSNDMRSDMTQIQSDVVKITQALGTVSQQISALQAQQPERDGYMSKAGMYKFCLDFERLNKGIRCPQL